MNLSSRNIQGPYLFLQ